MSPFELYLGFELWFSTKIGIVSPGTPSYWSVLFWRFYSLFQCSKPRASVIRKTCLLNSKASKHCLLPSLKRDKKYSNWSKKYFSNPVLGCLSVSIVPYDQVNKFVLVRDFSTLIVYSLVPDRIISPQLVPEPFLVFRGPKPKKPPNHRWKLSKIALSFCPSETGVPTKNLNLVCKNSFLDQVFTGVSSVRGLCTACHALTDYANAWFHGAFLTLSPLVAHFFLLIAAALFAWLVPMTNQRWPEYRIVIGSFFLLTFACPVGNGFRIEWRCFWGKCEKSLPFI